MTKRYDITHVLVMTVGINVMNLTQGRMKRPY